MKSRILQTNIAIYMILALGALFGVLFLRTGVDQKLPVLIAGSHTIPITIADTVATLEQGLSGTKSLARGTGKLFVFDRPDLYGFWMKDMQYPIDIVWIDADLQVRGVVEALDPASYPGVVYPPSPVTYVLEINAHEAGVDNLVVGTQLQLKK